MVDQVVVASYNIKYTVTKKAHTDAVCKLINKNPGLSVIGLQESGQAKHPPLRKIENWRLIAPRILDTYKKNTPDPILVKRSEWRVLDSGAHRLNVVTKLPAGAPFGDERARWCTWVKLKSKHNEGVWVVGNVHMMPGNNYDDQHRAVYRRQMSNLMRWAKPRRDDRLLLIGDFNTLHGDAKNKPMRDDGLKSVHQVLKNMNPPTHRRDIDHVWLYPEHNEVAWGKVLRGYPSDHKPLVVKVKAK